MYTSNPTLSLYIIVVLTLFLEVLYLSDYVGLKEPGPKVDSDPGYQFYALGQAFGLPLMGNEGPFCF